jgi:hypothetical protein
LYNRAKTSEDYVQSTSAVLKKLGPRLCMHHGCDHLTTTISVNRAPYYLLMILWMLCYCTHDNNSSEQFINFLRADKFPPPDGLTECTFPNINFFHDYILIPIMDIVAHLVDSTTSISCVQKILIEKYNKDTNHHLTKNS